MPVRLGIVCTHPIQYQSPVFAALARRPEIELRVFYGWKGATESAYDPGFGKSIVWDIPLLEGYDYEFVDNVSRDPGTHHYRGIDLPSLPSRIQNWKADAILVYGWCYKAHLQVMRGFKGRLPVLFRGDSTLLDEKPGTRRWIRRRVLRWVYRHVDAALYVGSCNRTYFEAHGLRDDQLVFAPHAVENERFVDQGACESASRLRSEYGIGENQLAFLFAGKLEAKKAPDLLLRAIAKCGDQNVHLLCAGSGALEGELRRLATKNTHFLGFQNQSMMPSVYHAADLVILPSCGPGETWGLALNEAMACSRAVLASDRVGAAVDLIRSDENGWIFPSEDESALVACLQQAIGQGREGLKRMGQVSRSIVTDWSIDRQVDAISAAVCKCVNDG